MAFGVGDVGADQVLDVPHRRGQPADERVDRAGADGPTGPAGSACSSGSSGISLSSMTRRGRENVRTVSPVDARPRRRPCRPCVHSRSRAVTDCTTMVYCWRSSSASANRNGRSPCWQNSAMVQKNGRTPVGTGAGRGRGVRVALPGRGEDADCRNGAGGSPSGAYRRSLLVVELGVGMVEEEQVLALDVEDQAPWCWRPRHRAPRSGTASRAGRWRSWSWWRRRRCRRC